MGSPKGRPRGTRRVRGDFRASCRRPADDRLSRRTSAAATAAEPVLRRRWLPVRPGPGLVHFPNRFRRARKRNPRGDGGTRHADQRTGALCDPSPRSRRAAGPLALLEVGASAGLCLPPDRYDYDYDYGERVLPGTPVFPCRVDTATPLPERVPEIVWRAGLDLNPLDVTDEEGSRVV
ncbi:MAG TPA: DUF2332 family protein [Amycolatopsis sp.]|nr:DUF2332 family protein [Amycolatopsis sp.]HKS47230.1 DUF2332 family protein [Amycolatopsis sp.]